MKFHGRRAMCNVTLDMGRRWKCYQRPPGFSSFANFRLTSLFLKRSTESRKRTTFNYLSPHCLLVTHNILSMITQQVLIYFHKIQYLSFHNISLSLLSKNNIILFSYVRQNLIWVFPSSKCINNIQFFLGQKT